MADGERARRACGGGGAAAGGLEVLRGHRPSQARGGGAAQRLARRQALRPALGQDALLRALPEGRARARPPLHLVRLLTVVIRDDVKLTDFSWTSRLQTCIGKANYAQFFTIAVTGTIQFVLQVAYGVSCLLWLEFWLEADPVHSAASYAVLEAFLVACTLISVPCMFMYFVLLGFHLYLMVLGYGTYEWMLRRRKQQRAKAEARRAQAQAEAGKADPTRGSEATTHRASSDADERPVSRHTSSVGSSSDFVSVDASDSLPPSARELTPL